MSEEDPILGFLEGCAIGFVLAFLACVLLTVCFSLLVGAPSPHGPVTADGIFSSLFGVIFGGIVVFLIFLFVKKLAHALSERRFYRAMGLVSFALIPSLYFGVCTMPMGNSPVVSSPPTHRNPPVSAVDSRQNGK